VLAWCGSLDVGWSCVSEDRIAAGEIGQDLVKILKALISRQELVTAHL